MSIALPRHTNVLPVQPATHKIGNVRSRASSIARCVVRSASSCPRAKKLRAVPGRKQRDRGDPEGIRLRPAPAGANRQETTRGNLQRIERGESVSTEPRPPYLAFPDLGAGALPERLRVGIADQPNVEPRALCTILVAAASSAGSAPSAPPTGASRMSAAPEHRLALRERDAEGVGGKLPAGLIGVKESGIKFAPAPSDQAARRRADHSDVGAPHRAEQPVQVVGRRAVRWCRS